jgi:hypothetical protein
MKTSLYKDIDKLFTDQELKQSDFLVLSSQEQAKQPASRLMGSAYF